MENGMSVRQTIFVTTELRVRRRTENPLIPLPSSEFDDGQRNIESLLSSEFNDGQRIR